MVEVEVRPATATTYTEDTWELEIWTDATATTSVGGVKFHLDFDRAIPTVIDSDAQASGIYIQPDTTTLNITPLNIVDNSARRAAMVDTRV